MANNSVANPKVVILGAAKSGTTGLFFKIRNSLPGNTRCLFEPDDYQYVPAPGDDSRPVLVKVLFGDPSRFDYRSFEKFDKKIFILRDPRDRVISEMLFWVCESNLWRNSAKFSGYLDMLRQKEQDPACLSVIDLVKAGRSLSDPHFSWTEWTEKIKRRLKWTEDFIRNNPQYFLLKYEDFVRAKLSELENYLGFALRGDAVVKGWADIVVRTKASGDWRNWFTKEDVDYYLPIMESFLRKFNYPGEWRIAPDPKIDAEDCTNYIIKTVEKVKKVNAVMFDAESSV